MAQQASANEENKNQQAPEGAPASDAEKNKGLGIVAYLGILWIVPLLAAKDSEFAMFHANQGLNLFILEVVLMFVWVIPILGWIIGFFGWIFTLVLALMGIINAANARKKELPVIGGYRLLS